MSQRRAQRKAKGEEGGTESVEETVICVYAGPVSSGVEMKTLPVNDDAKQTTRDGFSSVGSTDPFAKSLEEV